MTYMSFPQMAQALLNDAIDGAFLTEPSLSKALTAGAAEIIAPDHVMFPNHQIAVTLFSERFIKRDRKVAVGFMKAMLRGSRDYMSVVRDGRRPDRRRPRRDNRGGSSRRIGALETALIGSPVPRG